VGARPSNRTAFFFGKKKGKLPLLGGNHESTGKDLYREGRFRKKGKGTSSSEKKKEGLVSISLAEGHEGKLGFLYFGLMSSSGSKKKRSRFEKLVRSQQKEAPGSRTSRSGSGKASGKGFSAPSA